MAVRHWAAASITAYQQHLSPRKGFTCAHRRLHGGESCSEYGKRRVLEAGLWAALNALGQRFRACRAARQALLSVTDQTSDGKSTRKRRAGTTETSCGGWEDFPCDAGCCALDVGLSTLLSGIGCCG